jgi:hypothetical protein
MLLMRWNALMSHKHGDKHKQGNPKQNSSDPSSNPNSIGSEGQAGKKVAKWFVIPDWWTAVSTTILAVFAIGSFILLWIQLEDARQAFIKDQRPYVWIAQEQAPVVKLGEKLAWNYHYTDFGKSPALGVAVRCQIRLAAHKTPELKDMFDPIHKRGFEYEGLVVPPNDTTNWSTCFSDETINDDDLKLMNMYDGGAKLTLFFEYYDTSWNRYTSQVCRITRRPGAGSLTAVCPAENKIN